MLSWYGVRFPGLCEFHSKAKVLYRLTRKGIDLLPIMIEINLWGEKYFTIPDDRKAMLKEVKKDRAGFIKAAIKELESK